MASVFSRILGAILLLTTLSACVGPGHRGHYGGGGYGRSQSYFQPAFRGGHGGGHGGWNGGHHRGWR